MAIGLPSRASLGTKQLTAMSPPADALAVVDFWRTAGRRLWFAKDADFDRQFRERFQPLHEQASRGRLNHWLETSKGTLALVLLLDQFPRNAFRDTARMYATDKMARDVATDAIKAGHDLRVDAELRLFVYLPFSHSENLADQERSVELCRSLSPSDLSDA